MSETKAPKKKGLISSLYSNASKADKQAVVTEEELLKKYEEGQAITPEDVLKLKTSTQKFLCRQTDNVYHIEFIKFKLRDVTSNRTLFEVTKPDHVVTNFNEENDATRYVRYNFSSNFLKLKTIGATVEFAVGEKPAKEFFMIERHFFGDQLLKSFDFKFGFCVPNSRNSIEHIYEFPTLSNSQIEDMIQNPYKTRSDTFYFVENRLIMHNKADYSYSKLS